MHVHFINIPLIEKISALNQSGGGVLYAKVPCDLRCDIFLRTSTESVHMSCVLIIICMHAKKEARRTKYAEEHVVVGLSVNVLK